MPKPNPEFRKAFQAIRQSHPLSSVLASVSRLRDLRVLVVGDIIVDEYAYCQVMGTTSKYACLSARETSIQRMLGGAVAVARHVQNFAGHTTFVSCAGKSNGYEDYVASATENQLKDMQLFLTPKEPLVVKRRYISGGYPHALNRSYHPAAKTVGTRIFEISSLPENEYPAETFEPYLEKVSELAQSHDLVIVCDFGHGAVNSKLYEAARSAKSRLAVNIQTNSSNFGFNTIRKLDGAHADYLCIDEVEARLPFNDREAPFDAIFQRIQGRFARSLTITRGGSGLAVSEGEKFFQIPAFSTETVDTVGAGDTVLSVTALLDAVGAPRAELALLGSLAGHLATQIVGNERSLGRDELLALVESVYDLPKE